MCKHSSPVNSESFQDVNMRTAEPPRVCTAPVEPCRREGTSVKADRDAEQELRTEEQCSQHDNYFTLLTNAREESEQCWASCHGPLSLRSGFCTETTCGEQDDARSMPHKPMHPQNSTVITVMTRKGTAACERSTQNAPVTACIRLRAPLVPASFLEMSFQIHLLCSFLDSPSQTVWLHTPDDVAGRLLAHSLE